MRATVLTASLLTAAMFGVQPADAGYTIYTFEVSAGEETSHALSHVEFKFTEEGSTIMAPYGDGVAVKRDTHCGAESVDYVVVRDADDVIKFEDASDGLGEDSDSETDTFLVYVQDSDSPSVIVTTKASTGEIGTVITVEEGASISDALGFTVTLVNIEAVEDPQPLYD